ncbi:NUDIX domain-containing protein [Roseobacter sp.]|uniref:NUDIX domain-containing protein n=1 Tax=Roseobacter sp. TaxID=1907202 RepID=UPI00385C4202
MTPLFFFGTLRHPALIEAVLGDVAHLQLSDAAVSDYAIEAVAEGPFPTIVARQGSQGPGLLVEGVTKADLKRLDFFERSFGYELKDVMLADGTKASAYLPQLGLWTADGAWSLETWVETWGALSVFAAREVMRYMGQKSPDDIAQMFPMIRARAWSHLNALQSRHGAGTLMGKVDVVERRRVYAQYFALDEFDLSHARFDGSMTPILMRGVFLAPDAALVLPYDPVRDRVLVVEQMRMGPLARGDHVVWQLEPVAGRLDPGESPEDAARREAREETGLNIGALHPVGECYGSPGNSSEFHYSYVGLVDLPDQAAGVGGLASEDEDIRSHVMPFDELLRLCDAQQIANSPLVLIAYWLARHQARLRASS